VAPPAHELPKPAGSAAGPKAASPAEVSGSNAGRHGADVEALASAALNHFVQGENQQARRAAERVLKLDPGHKGARELLTLLGALG
jgi:Flp pilus assembly protein TadD